MYLQIEKTIFFASNNWKISLDLYIGWIKMKLYSISLHVYLF